MLVTHGTILLWRAISERPVRSLFSFQCIKIGNIVGGYGKISYLCCCFFTAIKFMAIKIDAYEILRPNGRTAGFA